MTAQTVTFKPDPTTGEDAYVFTTGSCNPSQYPAPPRQLNFGNDPEIGYLTWTYNSQGCSNGTHRSFIRFSGLNTLPAGATITSATLNLFGVSSSQILPSNGNSDYPGSSFSSNPGWVKRVTGNWNENTITWNNQPNTTTTNQVAIPHSTQQWNWNTSVDVTNLVQDIISSGNNNGFMLKLKTEAKYRSVLFASSDNSNSSLRPELVVNYDVCDSNFNYCSSTDHPYTYDFYSTSGDSGYWYVNGSLSAILTSSFHPTFAPSSHNNVRFVTGGKNGCSTSIKICVPSQYVIYDLLTTPPVTNLSNAERPIQMTKSIPGDTNMMIPQNVSVSPNPTHNRWKIDLQTIKSGEVSVILFDLQGKKIKAYSKELKAGGNSFYQDASNLSSGAYILQLKKGQFTVRKKLLRK